MTQENTTQSKKKYVNAWNSHIDTLYILCFTENKVLSDDVKTTINHLKELVLKVAETKKLN